MLSLATWPGTWLVPPRVATAEEASSEQTQLAEPRDTPAVGSVAEVSDVSPDSETSEDARENADPAPGPLAGHSAHGEAFNTGPRQAARLLGATGEVSLAVTTTSDQAQQFFNQGIGQLHGFWYFEAERSFRQVIALDPDCAMAYWGMAMANINNVSRAKELIAEAAKRKESASERERLWIEAWAEYYAESKTTDAQKRRQLVRRLENIVHQYPDELEAKAFLAVTIWQNSSKGVPLSSHQSVDALLDQVFAASPTHPAHHYRIHLWDKEKPARALRSAALCGPAAPAIAHMWHMPGHIYSELKRYDHAVWQQEASSRVDHAAMLRERLMPDQIFNYAHNQEWLIRNLGYLGRTSEAIALAKNMIELPRHPRFNTLDQKSSSQYGRQRLLETLVRYERWEELLQLAESEYLPPTQLPREQARRLRSVGLAQFGLEQIEAGSLTCAALDSLLAEQQAAQKTAGEEAQAKALASATEKPTQADRNKARKAATAAQDKFNDTLKACKQALAELRGHEALAKGEPREALRHLGKVSGVDKALLARVYLAVGESANAEREARAAVSSGREQVYPLANLAYVLHAVGKSREAARTMEQLRTKAAEADLDNRVFGRLGPLVAELELPEDWRLAAPEADDLGQRPELDSLGPRYWQPGIAPSWTLPDEHGKQISLAEYRGRPVVVIFYLGHGCLHCVEQLQTFGPKTRDFEQAGIALVAISSDSPQVLRRSIEAIRDTGETSGEADEHASNTNGAGEAASDAGLLAFPIVSDAELSAFKAYRAYDDFEQQPLHATLLIDGQGLLRWQDISHEPFTDPDFLLEEAQRLLRLSGSAAP